VTTTGLVLVTNVYVKQKHLIENLFSMPFYSSMVHMVIRYFLSEDISNKPIAVRREKQENGIT